MAIYKTIKHIFKRLFNSSDVTQSIENEQQGRIKVSGMTPHDWVTRTNFYDMDMAALVHPMASPRHASSLASDFTHLNIAAFCHPDAISNWGSETIENPLNVTYKQVLESPALIDAFSRAAMRRISSNSISNHGILADPDFMAAVSRSVLGGTYKNNTGEESLPLYHAVRNAQTKIVEYLINGAAKKPSDSVAIPGGLNTNINPEKPLLVCLNRGAAPNF